MKSILAALLTLLCAAAPAATPAAAAPPPPMDRVAEVIAEGRLGRIKAVIVEQRGEILYEGYFDGADPEDRHDIRSAGKSITALALGRAIADGHVASLDVSPLSALGAQEAYGAITLRDLVTMSSALDCNDWDLDSPGQEDRMYPKREWTPHALAIPLNRGYARGRDGFGRFSYCTAGVFLAGRYIGEQAGTPFDAYVQRTLFDPLGITDVQWKRSRAGEVQAGGQIEMRPRDLARIGRLVLDQGTVGSERIVPEAWIEEMLTPYVRATDSDDYGYLWWLRAYRHGEFTTPGWYAIGNGGTTLVVFEELDAVVLVVAANYNQPGMHQMARDIIERGALPLLAPDRR
jgi:CubicO group peptidase (beta-lactamase class C family)